MLGGWDLSALVNALDATATPAERHLWLVRLMEWLRHAATPTAAEDSAWLAEPRTPLPVLRLKHLLNQLDRHPLLGAQVQALMTAFWRDVDAASLLAEFGFGVRTSFSSEWWSRVQGRILPATPDTGELALLFPMLFEADDTAWISELDSATAARAAQWLAPPPGMLRDVLLESLQRQIGRAHV